MQWLVLLHRLQCWYHCFLYHSSALLINVKDE